MSAPLLLIEDMPSLQLVYTAVLRKAGYDVVSAGTGAEGLRMFRAESSGIVLLDLMLPDMSGLEVMAEMQSINPEARVIVITANGSINKAVEAMRAGAYEFLVKPFDEGRLINVIENAEMELSRISPMREPLPEPDGHYRGFIGKSPEMQATYRKIASIGQSMATVFISGESGTGKEVCAQAVHDASSRARGPFVPLNCGAIPSDLLESEVFGHLRGSFTGAISDKIGAAGAADGGTLFLDEICEMDLNLQTKLLRFLQTSTIQPVGATAVRKVNVRIICATNRDPFAEVAAGRFREDLFYRLHVVPIHLPALRDRGEDVLMIAEEMLREFAREEGRAFERLSDEVKNLFRKMRWPGNVRQLLNVLRNVVVLNDGKVVTPTMLPLEILHLSEDSDTPDDPGSMPAGDAPWATNPYALVPTNTAGNRKYGDLIGRPLAEIERLVIEETISRNGGSVTRAARVLEVSPSTLYRKREGWQR